MPSTRYASVRQGSSRAYSICRALESRAHVCQALSAGTNSALAAEPDSSARGPIGIHPIPEHRIREGCAGNNACSGRKGCAGESAVRCLRFLCAGKNDCAGQWQCGCSAARQKYVCGKASARGLISSVRGRRSKGHNSVREPHRFTWPSSIPSGRTQISRSQYGRRPVRLNRFLRGNLFILRGRPLMAEG